MPEISAPMIIISKSFWTLSIESILNCVKIKDYLTRPKGKGKTTFIFSSEKEKLNVLRKENNNKISILCALSFVESD